MSRDALPLPQPRRFLGTARTDYWWVQPAITLVVFSSFIIYTTWAALQGNFYFVTSEGAHYLSPLYSPVLFDAPGMHSGHSWFGAWPSWWPAFLPASPALFILWMPGGFRFTCYYYRGAYYKAFWQDPTSCAVGEPKLRGQRYRGEHKLPLVFQNLHRYFMYLAVAFLFVLLYDAIRAHMFTDEHHQTSFGIGVGTIVLTLNFILLAGYTFGCHSLRHLIGGSSDSMKKTPLGGLPYRIVSWFNRRHMQWAWVSLFWVGFSDVYVRMCAMGVWTDLRII